MTNSVRKEVMIPARRERVWKALTTSASLAEWMYPNDFEPKVGHRFTFNVPANLKVGFPGLAVRCEVLEMEPPARLVFSWSAGAPVENTTVTFRLEPDGDGTKLILEHAGFDLTHPFGKQAFGGAGYGWEMMLKRLADVTASKGE